MTDPSLFWRNGFSVGSEWLSLEESRAILGTSSGLLPATQIGFGSGFGVLTGDSGFVFDATNKFVGIGQATPLAPLHIGALPPGGGSIQAAIVVGRDSGWLPATDGHGIAVIDHFSVTGADDCGYAAFDSQWWAEGTSDYKHSIDFQARHIYASPGTSGRYTSFDSKMQLRDGGAVTHAWMLYFQGDLGVEAGTTIGDFANIYIDRFDPAKVTGRTFAIRQNGEDIQSYLEGLYGFGNIAPTAQVHIGGSRDAPSWTTTGAQLAVHSGQTLTDTTGTGTITVRAASSFGAAVFAADAVQTITNAATVYIGAEPSAGANTTITNSWGLYAAGGRFFVRDGVQVGPANLAANGYLSIAGGYSGPSWTTAGKYLSVLQGGTLTDTTGTGTVTVRAVSSFGANTLAASNVQTITNAATVYIANEPTAGANTTITNGWALYIAQGRLFARDSVNVGPANNTLNGFLSVGGDYSGPSWTTVGRHLTVLQGGTMTDTSSAAAATVVSRVASSIGIPTFASTNAITVTNATTLYVAGAPAAGTNTVITNSWAAWIAGSVYLSGAPQVLGATALPAGGTAGTGYKFSAVENFGVFFGSGAPTLSAAKGSLYLRSNGSGPADRMYVNTDGAAAWTAVATAT